MKLLVDEKDAIKRVSLISGQDYNLTKDFFESLVSFLIFNYIEGKDTTIPFIGNLEFIDTEEFPICKFYFSDNLKKIINQIKEEGMENEIKKIYERKIESELSIIAEPDKKWKEQNGQKIDIEA